jgi:hypothetical protein
MQTLRNQHGQALGGTLWRRAASSTAPITLFEAKKQLGLAHAPGFLTSVEVKAAFRKRAFALHPDTSAAAKGSDEAFKHLLACYQLALGTAVDLDGDDARPSSSGGNPWGPSSNMTAEQLKDQQQQRKSEAWRDFAANPEAFAAGYAKAHAYDAAFRAQFAAEEQARAVHEQQRRQASEDSAPPKPPLYQV